MRKILIVLGAFVLLSHARAFAGESAEIKYIEKEGRARVSIGGREQKAEVGQRLSNGDTITTEEGTVVLLEFSNGTKLKIGKSSKISIGEAAEPRVVDLEKGSAFVQVKGPKPKVPLDKPRFRLKTRTAVMGVRGTFFFAGVSQPKDHPQGEDVWLCVREGEVTIQRLSDPEKEVAVPAGKGIVVVHGEPIPTPRVYKWPDKMNWNMDLDSSDLFSHPNWLDEAKRETRIDEKPEKKDEKGSGKKSDKAKTSTSGEAK